MKARADSRALPTVIWRAPAESTRRDKSLEIADLRVEQLLADLASTINSRTAEPFGPGRRSLPPGDKVFVTVARAQHRKSMRKVQPILKRLEAEQKIAFAPSKGSLVAYNTSTELTRFLQDAFTLTTAPYRLMERDIIIDSSGISSFFVSCWRLSESGTTNIQPATKWFKVHIAIGRESRAILGFALTEHQGEGTSDHANFKPLVDGIVRQGFDLRYVIADNAYLSAENHDVCKGHGAMLVGPIKPRNYSKSGRPSNAIRAILALRDSDPALYDELCRARQPIEGVFSMEKRLDNRLAAIGTAIERTDWKNGRRDALYVSRQNEVLARMIRHNLNCTVTEEQLRNRRILYSRGSLFSHVREIIDDVG